MKSIEINDIQAIEHVSIPIPEGGGVIVLKGNQGTGKSTALQAVQALAGRKVDTLSIRDGAKRGTIEFDGVKVVVTKSRTARSGELTVEIGESRFDLGVIVDPQILDEDRADAARIKQLLALTGAKSNPDAYWALLREYLDPSEIDELDIDDETDDPIDLHKRFVAAMQSIARRLEKAADTMRVDISELKEKFRGLNLRTPPVVKDIQHVYDECLKADHEVQERAKVAADQAKEIAEARDAIARLKSAYDGPSAQVAEQQRSLAETAAKEAYAAMITAEAAYKVKSQNLKEWETALRIARSHEVSIATAESVLTRSTVQSPTPDELTLSQETLTKSRVLLEEAIRANEGASLVRDAEEKNFEADRKERAAEDIRNACRQAESILAASVKLQQIRVEGNRLVVATDRSDSELFAELSHGERAIIAIREAAKFVPPHGLCSVSQEIWGGISEANKRLIDAEAKRQRVSVLTAEVTDEDELTAEVMA